MTHLPTECTNSSFTSKCMRLSLLLAEENVPFPRILQISGLVSIYFAHKGGPEPLESVFLCTTEYVCSCATKLQSMWTAYREPELFIEKLAFSMRLYSAVLSYFSFPLICRKCIQPALFFKGLVMNFLIPVQLISCLALTKFHTWLTMYWIKD